MIYIEAGLNNFLIETRVNVLVQGASRVLDLSHEIFPEFDEIIHSFLNDEAKNVWSELKLNHLEAAFSLCGYSTIICSLILLSENIFFFMTTLFLVFQFSSPGKFVIF